MEKLWKTLTGGLQEFCAKNGFYQAVLGLSGGIDSALTAVLAADVLGGENITAVMMKTKFTSHLSLNIAREIAVLNRLNYQELDIEPLVQKQIDFLAETFHGEVKNIVKENVQARLRGQILMAFSNQTGGLVLACGNKSEALTGYCTLYGDTCGGLAPIGNLYKTTIFQLAKWLNNKKHCLPLSVITRAPSAELALNQKDENFLPPYDLLDQILKALTDQHKTLEMLKEEGFDEHLVRQVQTLVTRSAFKRAQMAQALPIG